MEIYADISAAHHFVLVGMETVEVLLSKGVKELLLEVGHQVIEEFREPRLYGYLQKRIPISVQHGNAAAVLGANHIPRKCSVGESYP